MCMLVMTMIPVAAGATIEQETQTSDVGITTLQGFIFGMKRINGGAMIEFRCLFVHYIATSIWGERVSGFRFGGQMMVIGGDFKGVLMPHMIMGWVPGALEF